MYISYLLLIEILFIKVPIDPDIIYKQLVYFVLKMFLEIVSNN